MSDKRYAWKSRQFGIGQVMWGSAEAVMCGRVDDDGEVVEMVERGDTGERLYLAAWMEYHNQEYLDYCELVEWEEFSGVRKELRDHRNKHKAFADYYAARLEEV